MKGATKKAQSSQPTMTRQANEGEGSRTAARRYNAGVQQTIRSGHVEQKAREAARALDGAEGRELRDAEKRGKQAAERSRH